MKYIDIMRNVQVFLEITQTNWLDFRTLVLNQSGFVQLMILWSRIYFFHIPQWFMYYSISDWTISGK